MATRADVRRIALPLPGAVEERGRSALAVPVKGERKEVACVWLERIDPEKARVPNNRVLATAAGRRRVPR